MGKYDIGSKKVIHVYNRAWAEWVLQAELKAKQLLAYNNPMLLPFVPLMKGGNTEQMVRKCAEHIRQLPEQEAVELESILAIFASYVLDVETIRKILRWEMNIVRESPIIQEMRQVWFEEGIQKGIQRGRKEGIQKGERKATVDALNLVLVIRFDVLLGQFDELFEMLPLESLQKLNEFALRVNTLAGFKDELTKMVSN